MFHLQTICKYHSKEVLYNIIVKRDDFEVQIQLESETIDLDCFKKFLIDIKASKSSTVSISGVSLSYDEERDMVTFRKQPYMFSFKNCFEFITVMGTILENEDKVCQSKC